MFYIGSEYIYSPDDGSIYMNNDKVLSITGIRQTILELLLEKKGQFITRNQFVKEVWGKDDLSIYNAALTQQIYLLRKDLHKIGIDGMIYSNSRQGYKLVEPKIPTFPDEDPPVNEVLSTNASVIFSLKNLKNTQLIISLLSIGSTLINFLIFFYILLFR